MVATCEIFYLNSFYVIKTANKKRRPKLNGHPLITPFLYTYINYIQYTVYEKKYKKLNEKGRNQGNSTPWFLRLLIFY